MIPFACAARISARRKPNVIRPAAGRRASRAAQTLIPSAAASISMCAASESSASESATNAEHDLGGHERDDQREGDGERPDLGLGRDAVVVMVVVVRHP